VGNAAGSLPEPATRLIAIALNNGQRLARLVNDILDIHKMEFGEVVFQLKCVDVRSVTEQAIEDTRGFAGSYGVEIRCESCAQPANVYADADRLVQVLTNLLSNALKFSPTGGEVVLAIKILDHSVRVSVRDWGAGIPDSFKHQIFERFAQADTSDARQRGGSGLGLNIARQIVTRLGGTVWFESPPSGGTIFFVDLPHFHEPARTPSVSITAQPAMYPIS
jgi:signal transduction histidine kinase